MNLNVEYKYKMVSLFLPLTHTDYFQSFLLFDKPKHGYLVLELHYSLLNLFNTKEET